MSNVLEILKQLPKGTKVYCTVTGKMSSWEEHNNSDMPIKVKHDTSSFCLYDNGTLVEGGECVVFPSKDHRTWSDWRKYYNIKKQPGFKPFDKVLVRDAECSEWKATFFSHYNDTMCPHTTIGGPLWIYCIPYEGNEKLLGTTDSPNN